MKIFSVGIKNKTPYFTSRSRMGQDNTIKNYQENPFTSPIRSDVLPVDKSYLIQRFDFHTAEDKIKPEDRTYDSFTGLRDKNYLLKYLEVAMHEAQIENKPLSIAMFDMDDFKSINELLGYEIGDIFIKEISKCISNIAHAEHVNVYRFGGEEFVLIFDNQTDAQKAKIAREIVQGVRLNRTIQSYSALYTKNAQSRLDKSIYSTSKIQKISALETKKETIKEVIAGLNSDTAKNDPYFTIAQDTIDSQIRSSYLNLIQECLCREKDDNIRALLGNVRSKLLARMELLDSEQSALDEYLYSIYDKANEIYQTKKWIRDYDRNNGFGITCGVVNIEPESIEYKSPMDIVGIAGKVLKKGKNTQKAQVYTETIRI